MMRPGIISCTIGRGRRRRYSVADVPEAVIAAARMLFVSGISQGISVSACDAVFAAIDVAVRHGVSVAYDTNYRPRLWPPERAAAVMHAAMWSATYALPGFDDVQVLTGLTDPDAMLDFYLRLGPKVVVLRLGAAGAYLATADGVRVRIPVFPVVAVDATGAGDALCGSFLARILAGMSRRRRRGMPVWRRLWRVPGMGRWGLSRQRMLCGRRWRDGVGDRYQGSWNGRISTLKDQAERSWWATCQASSAIAVGLMKKSSALSL
jgi:sugar/nucleoside kinase (ribokinase family)